jgi:hypothetical protein
MNYTKKKIHNYSLEFKRSNLKHILRKTGIQFSKEKTKYERLYEFSIKWNVGS